MGGLSHGMRKRILMARILMACAFLGDPKLIILDEPLNGLDVQGVLLLKDRLEQSRRAGSHVLLCSHILDFVQDFADRAYLINQGRIVNQIDHGGASLEEAYRSEFMGQPPPASQSAATGIARSLGPNGRVWWPR